MRGTAVLQKWYFWATHSRLPPMIDAARTIKRHRDGILRWFHSAIANGLIEGINSLVQAAKAKARGYPVNSQPDRDCLSDHRQARLETARVDSLLPMLNGEEPMLLKLSDLSPGAGRKDDQRRAADFCRDPVACLASIRAIDSSSSRMIASPSTKSPASASLSARISSHPADVALVRCGVSSMCEE